MTARFFCNGSLNGPSVTLTDAEAHHLIHVLRMSAGEAVELFNGRDCVAQAKIVSTGRRHAELHVLRRRLLPADARLRLTIASAVPKGDRCRWMIEKLTEFGIDRFVSLRTERSVVDPGRSQLAKLRQTVISACRQSGRNRLLSIEQPQELDKLLDAVAAEESVLVADRGGVTFQDTRVPAAASKSLTMIVGPEGGLTPRELQAARSAGATPVCLGPGILRIETAAIAFASLSCQWAM